MDKQEQTIVDVAIEEYSIELRAGTLLQGGRYRIVKAIGQGGFGITYLAEQTMAGRKVCIKEYFPAEYYNRDADTNRISLGSQGSADVMSRYKEKFIKEARTLASLNHPHIIPVHDVFEENDTAYYVMEYIEGETISDIVRRDGALAARGLTLGAGIQAQEIAAVQLAVGKCLEGQIFVAHGGAHLIRMVETSAL